MTMTRRGRATSGTSLVELLVVIDSDARVFSGEQAPPGAEEAARLAALFYRDLLGAAGQGLPLADDALSGPSSAETLRALEEAGGAGVAALGIGHQSLRALRQVFESNLRAARGYAPRPYAGTLTFFEASQSPPEHGWEGLAGGGVEVHRIEGDHYSILRSPHVEVLAARLRECLDRVAAGDVKPEGRRDVS